MMDYRKIMNMLATGNKWQFDLPKSVQLRFLEEHPIPSNDIKRAFFQYKAQMLFVPNLKRLLFNFLTLWVIIPFLVIAFIKRFKVRFVNKQDAILERNTHIGVIPKCLSDKYSMSSEGWNIGWSFGFKDIYYILKVCPYIIRSPYFVFKILFKSALYSTIIKTYNPNAIIVFNEFSFTSSALTYYCERYGIKHIDVMHGEKLFYIRDSYFRFSETYVWEPYYVDLFSKMNAPKEQFVPALPPYMSIESDKYANPTLYADYTYYLAKYNEEEIEKIVDSMNFAKSQGKRVKYRPHPRYSDVNLLRKYVKDEDIEDTNMVDIMTSVANTDCAAGVFTTVLNQAYHSGKKILIDDVNFPDEYNKLEELEYSLFNKPVGHLSYYQQ